MDSTEIENFVEKLKAIIKDIDEVKAIVCDVPDHETKNTLYFKIGNFGRYQYRCGCKNTLEKLNDIIHLIIENRGLPPIIDKTEPSMDTIVELINTAIDLSEPAKGSLITPPAKTPLIIELIKSALVYSDSQSDEDLINLAKAAKEYSKIHNQ